MKINLKRNQISKKILDKITKEKLSSRFDLIFKKISAEKNNKDSFFNILNTNFNLNFNLKDLKRFQKFQKILVIGMGGSILGSEAIYDFLKNKIKKKVYFFNDLDAKKVSNFEKQEDLRKTLILVISKSGNTVETLTNFLSLNILKKKSKNIILVSERKDNILFSISKKFDLFYIEHKSFIGGRFSVLSEVGIVPAFLMGLDIVKLRKNINKYFLNQNKKFLKESCLIMAYLLIKKRYKNLIFLNYEPKLEKFLFWIQQLIAESLGKNGKGFLPLVSNVPKDHHSLLQLYLDGPKDKLFWIFSSGNDDKKKINTKKINDNIAFLHKKTFAKIKTSQKNSLIKIFQKKEIPFREFTISKFDEETIGELFCYSILETIIVGKLAKIDPFNQPAVEQVKVLTKKLLIKSSKNNF